MEDVLEAVATRRAAVQALVDDLLGKPYVVYEGRILPRIAGAEDDEVDDDDDEVVDDDDDDDTDDDDDDDDDDDGTHARVPKSELDRLKRIAAEKDRDERDAEKARKKAEERARRERGEWDEMLSEKDEKIAEVEAERDEAHYQLQSFKRQIRVTQAAQRLGFRDPTDAEKYISEDEAENDTDAERALKRVLREKPYLRQDRPASGLPGGGGADVDGLTVEEIRKMSPEEINARWAEVQRVMEASGQPTPSR
jgi:hypothetical protein